MTATGCLLLVAAQLTACASPSADAGPRVPIPNTNASVALPRYWKRPGLPILASGPVLTLAPVNAVVGALPTTYPEIHVRELRRPAGGRSSLRAYAESRMQPRDREATLHSNLRTGRVDGIELVRFDVETRMDLVLPGATRSTGIDAVSSWWPKWTTGRSSVR
jgi:hypothetical protein